jgi:hypothetical protein
MVGDGKFEKAILCGSITMAWCLLGLQTEIWRVVANVLDKSQTVDIGWSSSFGVG